DLPDRAISNPNENSFDDMQDKDSPMRDLNPQQPNEKMEVGSYGDDTHMETDAPENSEEHHDEEEKYAGAEEEEEEEQEQEAEAEEEEDEEEAGVTPAWREVLKQWNVFTGDYVPHTRPSSGAAFLDSGRYQDLDDEANIIHQQCTDRIEIDALSDFRRSLDQKTEALRAKAEALERELDELDKNNNNNNNNNNNSSPLLQLLKNASTEKQKYLRQSIEELKKIRQRQAEYDYDEAKVTFMRQYCMQVMKDNFEQLKRDKDQLLPTTFLKIREAGEQLQKQKRLHKIESMYQQMLRNAASIKEKKQELENAEEQTYQSKEHIKKLQLQYSDLSDKLQDITQRVQTQQSHDRLYQHLMEKVHFMQAVTSAEVFRFTEKEIGFVFMTCVYLHVTYDKETQQVQQTQFLSWFKPSENAKGNDEFSLRLIEMCCSVCNSDSFVQEWCKPIQSLGQLQKDLMRQLINVFHGVLDLRRNLDVLKQHQNVFVEILPDNSNGMSTKSQGYRDYIDIEVIMSKEDTERHDEPQNFDVIAMSAHMRIFFGYPWKRIALRHLQLIVGDLERQARLVSLMQKYEMTERVRFQTQLGLSYEEMIKAGWNNTKQIPLEIYLSFGWFFSNLNQTKQSVGYICIGLFTFHWQREKGARRQQNNDTKLKKKKDMFFFFYQQDSKILCFWKVDRINVSAFHKKKRKNANESTHTKQTKKTANL
ncbi:HAM group protein, partial [Reticulomyxa filosa]